MSSTAPTRDRTSPPEAGPIRPFHLPPIQADRLDNGMAIRSMARAGIPLVHGYLVLDAGESVVAGDRAGLAVLTGDALQGGTDSRSGAELAEALEELGVSLSVSTGWDATTLSFTCVAERVGQTLELVSEVVRTPAFPEHEVTRVRRQQLASIRQRTMDPAQLATDELDRAVFPAGHPYHRVIAGEPETVGALDGEAARKLVEARYRPGGAGFVLVGDLSSGEVGELARNAFGEWRGDAAPNPEFPDEAAEGERPIVIVHREGSVQSEIRIGQPGPSRGTDGDAALEVGNTILGGAFTSRLNLNLREKHGFTYGVSSRFSQRRRGGRFLISTSVQSEVTAQALEEAVSELRGFVAEGPTDEEVEQARDYLAGVFPLRMETGRQLASRMAELLIYGLPEEHHHQYRDRIRSTSKEDVTRIIEVHLAPDDARIVIVGDAEVIRKPLEESGLGPVQVRTP